MNKCRMVLVFAWVSLGSLAAFPAAQNRTVAGIWNGVITVAGGEMAVSVNLQQANDRTWMGTVDIPVQSAKGLSLSNIAIDGQSVSFSIAGIPGNPSFSGRLSDDTNTILGNFIQGPGKATFKLTRSETGQAVVFRRPQEPTSPLPYDAVEVSFKNWSAGITLAGTLTLPRDRRPSPAVVLISGSGPQDRDESFAGHKPFLVLADYGRRYLPGMKDMNLVFDGSTEGLNYDRTIKNPKRDKWGNYTA